jgi:hypothetical protein
MSNKIEYLASHAAEFGFPLGAKKKGKEETVSKCPFFVITTSTGDTHKVFLAPIHHSHYGSLQLISEKISLTGMESMMTRYKFEAIDYVLLATSTFAISDLTSETEFDSLCVVSGSRRLVINNSTAETGLLDVANYSDSDLIDLASELP